jgi:hypothetical protein
MTEVSESSSSSSSSSRSISSNDKSKNASRTHLSDDNDNNNVNDNNTAETMAGSRGFVQHVVGSLANASDVTMIEQSQARV